MRCVLGSVAIGMERWSGLEDLDVYRFCLSVWFVAKLQGGLSVRKGSCVVHWFSDGRWWSVAQDLVGDCMRFWEAASNLLTMPTMAVNNFIPLRRGGPDEQQQAVHSSRQ